MTKKTTLDAIEFALVLLAACAAECIPLSAAFMAAGIGVSVWRGR